MSVRVRVRVIRVLNGYKFFIVSSDRLISGYCFDWILSVGYALRLNFYRFLVSLKT